MVLFDSIMEPFRFAPFGPFKLPHDDGIIEDSKKKEFWDSVQEKYQSLPEAVGCYIFAIQSIDDITPWYVGKTERMNFRRETWQDIKLRKYEKAIRSNPEDEPVLFLIARVTKKNAFRRPTTGKIRTIAVLEELLIQKCLQKNPALLNSSLTSNHKRIVVPGFMNDETEVKSEAADSLKQLLKRNLV